MLMRQSLARHYARRLGLRSVALLAIAALVFPVGLASAKSPNAAVPGPTVDLQVLDISDWHGQLDPLNGVGGAAALSTYFDMERAKVPNTITLTAGDDFGATPALSAFFDDEPAVLAERLMGIDYNTFGNHNFDSGIDYLQNLIDLAGSTDPSVPGEPYEYVVSNLANKEAELDDVADYAIVKLKGVKVAIIGAINEEAPSLVFPGRFGSMTPTDSVQAVMAARARARGEGANVFIAIAHKGVTSFDAAGNAQGPLIEFAEGLQGFDLVVGDHTDVQWSGEINGALVFENRSKGVTYSRTVMKIHRGTGDVVSRTHQFITPTASAVTPDPAVVQMLAPYRVQLAAIMDQKIGVATARFPRGGNVERSGEVAIGNLLADAMRLRYGTDFGFTNSGGIRAPLPSGYVPLNAALDRTDPPPYDLVMGDPYEVLPFGNIVVVREISGAQLWAALENAVSRISPATGLGTDGRFAQISGFRFTFDSTRPAGSRVLTVVETDGTPIPNTASSTYTIALPDFVNTGGDGYTMFADGHGATRELMADVLRDYIIQLGTITPVIDGRIDDVAR
jgi:5'-nucleotidase